MCVFGNAELDFDYGTTMLERLDVGACPCTNNNKKTKKKSPMLLLLVSILMPKNPKS